MPRNDTAAPGHVCPGIRSHAIDIVRPPGIAHRRMDAHRTIVTAVLAAKSSANDTHNLAQRLSYSSWRRHQTPVSLRPLGARSSHWYMPQRPSSPRA